MQKTFQRIRLTPYLCLRSIRSILRKLGWRQPARKYYLAALSGGAIFIWTPGGNIVLPSVLARKLANDIPQAADLADQYEDRKNE